MNDTMNSDGDANDGRMNVMMNYGGDDDDDDDDADDDVLCALPEPGEKRRVRMRPSGWEQWQSLLRSPAAVPPLPMPPAGMGRLLASG